MSCQYIDIRYDAPPGGEAPQGKVMHTARLPQDLLPYLHDISVLKTPADSGILGPQYSYRIFRAGGHTRHVFSSVCRIKDEATGASGSVAHHFLLTEGEVETDDAQFLHFTPAGLILALDRMGFWRKHDSLEEADPNKILDTSTEALPDTEVETTWKKLTGDKELAALLNNDSFGGDCLILLPAPIDARDVLMLLHESDELSETHGWGRTFTTYGTAADDIAQTRRIALPICSPIIGEEAWNAIPMLCVNDRLRPDTTASLLLRDVDTHDDVVERRRRVHPERPVPYRYEETPDGLMFNIPLRRVNPLLCCAAPLVFIFILATGGFFLTPDKEQAAAPLPPPAKPLAAKPAKPAANQQTKPQRPRTHIKKDVVCHGQALPRDFASLLAKDDTVITIQHLSLKQERSKGPLSAIGASEKGVSVRVVDKKGNTRMVEIALTPKNELVDIIADGTPAAILIATGSRELLLIPPIYIKLPPIPPTTIPDINVNIKPSDLDFEKDSLVCKTPPDMGATGQVKWEEQPTLALPLFQGYNHIIICVPEHGVPFDLMTTPTKRKGDLRQMEIHLLVYNTFRQYFEQDFSDLVNLPVAPTVQDASIARIFELAEQMKQGGCDASTRDEYEKLRAPFLRLIPLPAYRDAPDFPNEVQEALCAMINRNMEQRFEQHREYAESYQAQLVLELGYVLYDKDTNNLRWFFTLHTDKTNIAPRTTP